MTKRIQCRSVRPISIIIIIIILVIIIGFFPQPLPCLPFIMRVRDYRSSNKILYGKKYVRYRAQRRRYRIIKASTYIIITKL